MSNLQGFWSYVHKDDEADRGRISQLARDVVAQYEMLTGESVELFLDRDALEWGDVWRDKIDASLASVAFFVAVVTPRYLMSPECRRELQFFARRVELLGTRGLVLPLHYVEVPVLSGGSSDDLVRVLEAFQWCDWRELRYSDVESETYRRAVAEMAKRIVEANRHSEQVVIEGPGMSESSVEAGDEAPGFVDQIADAEEALPRWNETLVALSAEIEEFGRLMQESTAEINQGSAQGKGFSHRLMVARRLAKSLDGPTERISSLSGDFSSQLYQVDIGIRAIIDLASREIENSPESRLSICGFFGVVRGLSQSAREGLSGAQAMIDAMAPAERISRDLRPVLRKIRQALTSMLEGRKVMDEWVRLIDASGIECTKEPHQPSSSE